MKKISSLCLSIPCKISELNLSISLQNGQSFRWQETSPGVWRGMIREGVWSFAQDDTNLYCVLHNLPLDGQFSAEASSKKFSMNTNLESSKKPTNKCTSDIGDASRRRRSRLSRKPSAVEEAENVVLSAIKQEPETNSTIESCSYSSPSPKRLKRLKTKEKCDIKPPCDFNITSNRIIHEAMPQSSCPLFDKYQCSYTSSNTSPDVANHYLDIVHRYFRLDVDLITAYKDWCKRDVNFQVAAQKCPGVRLLDQPPVENVFSFICSSNNNINRISSLVEKLSVAFGSKECEVDGHEWFSFPTIEALAGEGVEQNLRTLGFGYR
ncbi:8-oxoguanine DNA glycosylase N-terminal [Trinorchestia longiramus]|nr:8-oxoguanine DNA glycosylase N-terminal [Trinorchestia longiramus]